MSATPSGAEGRGTEIRVHFTESPGRGWVAEAVEVAAVAQGATKDEATDKLRELLHVYPEVVREYETIEAETELIAL